MDINPNLTLDQVVSQQNIRRELQQQQRGGGASGRGRGQRGGGGNTRRGNNNNNSDNDEQEGGIVIDRTVRVFIKNIPTALIERFDDKALLQELNDCTNGAVTRYTLFADRSGRFTGGAMATFSNAAAAEQAIKQLTGRQMMPTDEPLHLELAKEHGVVLNSKVAEAEKERKLAEQPWRHDRFNRMNRGFGGGSGGGRGGGGGGARGAGRGGAGAGAGAVRALDLDAQLDSFLS